MIGRWILYCAALALALDGHPVRVAQVRLSGDD
jgi:hypothetical protein